MQTGLFSLLLLQWPQLLSSALGRRRSSSYVWMSDNFPLSQISSTSGNQLLKKEGPIIDHSFGGSVHDHLAPMVWEGSEAKSSSGPAKPASWSGTHCTLKGIAL